MSLHRLSQITIGVPDVEATAAYYAEFGLMPLLTPPVTWPGDDPAAASSVAPPVRRFSTLDGGGQLGITHAPVRRLVEVGFGADDRDDIDRIAASLTSLEIPFTRDGDTLQAVDAPTSVRAVVAIEPRMSGGTAERPVYNGPGHLDRPGTRADGVLRTDRVRPRKLGHVVFGSVDQAETERFFTQGLGLKTSDRVPGLAAFLRCSTDHHNLLVQQAPVSFLHHTAWEVDDVDDVGRGATAMLEVDPARHVWGLGRHHVGSNFFWYLRDPAGNFSEYYSDLDCIVEDALWDPGVFEGARGLYSWGPPPPPSFLKPDDLAAFMTGSHAR